MHHYQHPRKPPRRCLSLTICHLGVHPVVRGGIGTQRPVQTIIDRCIPVGIIGDSLNKAATATATRPIPKSVGAQIRFLVRHEKGSTRTVAQRPGISQGTVERYLKGQIKTPRPELAAKLAAETHTN